MGRRPCCSKEGLNRGAWTAQEDKVLVDYIKQHGEGGWRNLPNKAGLKRCGKSCRLRWVNYLRPDIKRGNISADEEDLIIRLHKLLGNRWSLIAGRLPERTDNEIKNYWNSHLRKKVEAAAANSKLAPISGSSGGGGTSSSRVIRTRANRCSKVLLYSQNIMDPLIESQNHEDCRPMNQPSASTGIVPAVLDGHGNYNEEDNNISSDLMAGLGEFCLSDLLKPTFSDLDDLNDIDTINTLSIPASSESLVFGDEEMLLQDLDFTAQQNRDPDLRSLAPFNLDNISPGEEERLAWNNP